MKYPIPAHAASFWVAGDSLMVAFPGQGPEEHGHTVKFPASEGGLRAAITVLKDRAQARDLRLANRGTPTQYEVENDLRYRAFVKARKDEKKAAVQTREEAEAFLKELDL
jgi:hypothetical protein